MENDVAVENEIAVAGSSDGKPVVELNGNGTGVATRTLISMNNIWKTYQMGIEELHALRDVSFEVAKGEYLAIIGPSGSGKSTLMNLIGCLDSPSQGQYWINGQLVSDMTDDELARIRNKEIGFVFQTFNLLARATALHNVELPLIYAGMRAGERHEKAQAALASVELGDRVTHRPNELSGGQRQRVAIARALVKNARIILLDEATASLDSESERLVQDAMAHLCEGRTTIAIAHRLHTITHADRILVVENGSIVESGRHDELLRKSGRYAAFYRLQIKDENSVVPIAAARA